MLTSSYTNACDPNSMRDQGYSRNAEYQFTLGEPKKDTNP